MVSSSMVERPPLAKSEPSRLMPLISNELIGSCWGVGKGSKDPEGEREEEREEDEGAETEAALAADGERDEGELGILLSGIRSMLKKSSTWKAGSGSLFMKEVGEGGGNMGSARVEGDIVVGKGGIDVVVVRKKEARRWLTREDVVRTIDIPNRVAGALLTRASCRPATLSLRLMLIS